MWKLLPGLVILAACGSSPRVPDAAPEDPTGDAAPGGAACGGIAGLQCGARDYCDFAENNCGLADQQGTCRPRPQACPLVVGPPICGCDGQVHIGECSTYATGTDLNTNGGCPLEPTHFECGYTQCAIATQYCRRERVAGPETFSCIALPAACGTAATCGCLRTEKCAAMCSGEGKSGLTLTCG
jgi:hypothetical protein